MKGTSTDKVSSVCKTCEAARKALAAEEEKEPRPELVTVRVRIYFDGTGNNLYNIDEASAAGANGAWWNLKSRMREHRLSGDSYTSSYSNVALLSKHSPDPVRSDTLYSFSIYAEGIGTARGQSDARQLVGSVLGRGETGVPARVEWATQQVVERLKEFRIGKTQPVKIELALFGFSRGAAAARHCVHVLLGDRKADAESPTLKARMVRLGYVVDAVAVTFVGLFDTVASFGIDHSTNTQDLNLDAIEAADKVVQLAAADEYRKNFALTDITSAASGTEIYLPGVHSDIGGGYVDFKDDDEVMVLWLDDPEGVNLESACLVDDDIHPMLRDRLLRDKEWLIHMGWIEGEGHGARTTSADIGYNWIRITRKNIRSTYSRIPLRIMAALAGQIAFKGSLLSTTPLDGALGKNIIPGGTTVEKYLLKYATDSGPRGSALEDWAITPSWLTSLRHTHFHFSAQYDSIGMEPQFYSPTHEWSSSDSNAMEGKRTRRVYLG